MATEAEQDTKIIKYHKLLQDKFHAIDSISEALVEIKKENFHVKPLEKSGALERIIHSVGTLYQVAYANFLVMETMRK